MANRLERNRDQSPSGNRPNMSDLRIVLVGRSVSENNRVGNLILDKNVFGKKRFPPDVEEHGGEVKGRNITVINTVHLLKSYLFLSQIQQKVSELSPPEPHVIILVLQHEDFSEKKRDRLPSVLKWFGQQAMMRTMILTTDDEKRRANNKPENEFIQKISTECGGGCLQLTQNTQCSRILQKVDEIITHSGSKETQQSSSRDQVDTPNVFRRSGNQKLILAMCGCNEEMRASMSKLLLGKNTPISAQVSTSVCVWSDVKLHEHLISLVELPAVNQLSEEEMMRQTLRCVSLCDPGVDAFLIIVPVSPLTYKEKEGIEKILKIFHSCEHFILLFITDLRIEEHAKDFVQSSPDPQRLISRCGGQYRVMGLKEPENSRQIPELLDYIESMKTEPYSLQMYVKAQENRVRRETKEELMKMEIEKLKLMPDVGRSCPEFDRPIGYDLRIVLLGKNESENSRVKNVIIGGDTFERKVPQHRQRVGGRQKDRYVSVINSPHLLQTHLSLHHITQTVRECVNLSDPGPHVFILVLQHKDFTEEDIKRVKYVLKEFSEEAIKRTIVLTTDEQTYRSMISSLIMNNVIHQLIKECGGGHLQLDERKPEWQSEVFEMVDKLMEIQGEYLTCDIFHDVKGTSVDEEQNTSEEERSDEVSANISGKPNLNLVLCGSDATLKVSVSKLLHGNKLKPSHEGAIRSECVKKTKLHEHLISLVELPAVNQLSEEEVMRQTLRCVSLCDPGVDAFLIIVPVGPLTDEHKAEIEKIQSIFYSREHFILLFTTELIAEGFATDFVQSSPDPQRLISRCGGQYRIMGLKEPENSRQIPELLDYIENMKTEPYSLQMYVKAQENRVRQELEEQHKKELSEKENKIKELEQKIQSDGAEGKSDDLECLRIVLIGRTGNGKSATGNTILGRKEFKSQSSSDSVTTVCMKGVGEVDGLSVAVVDTPGLFDTTLKNEQVVEEIVKCVSLSSPGPHVFVIVLSVGRITKEEADTIDLIKQIFGPKAAQFSIVLFTRGDDLEDESIQDYVKRSNSAELKKLIRDCENRFLVFNNREKQDQSQVIQLLNMIEEVKNMNQGRYFTNNMFEEAEMSIKKRMEEILKEREREMQTQNEKLRVKYETEMEELKMRLENEKRKADEERKKREREFRQKEEKLLKDFEEKHKTEQKKQEVENQKRLEEENQKKVEYHQQIEEMKREMENQRTQYEKQQKERQEEDRKREEKYREDQEKMKNEQERIIMELCIKQEEEKAKREREERKKIEQEEEERQEWKIKIKEAENDRKEIQEEIKRQQREWEDEKKRKMSEREEEERKRKERHEQQLKEKQEEMAKMRKKIETEREEERQKIEEERQQERRKREEKEREYDKNKTEMKLHYEKLQREREEEWERRKRAEDERREEERNRWKEKIEELKQEQEEEIKRREKEENERKESEQKARNEMKQKHEEEIKVIKKKHEDEAREQAEQSNEFRERKEQHVQELQQMLDERQKQQKLLEELFNQLEVQKGNEIKELQEEVEKLCQNLQNQKEKEINELKKQTEALNEHLKDQKGEKIEALQQEVEQLLQSLQDQKGDKINDLQEEAKKINQWLQDKKEEHFKKLQEEAEERQNKSGRLCLIL